MAGRNVVALQDAAEQAGKAILQRSEGSSIRSADEWDAHVGRRVREARVLKGLTQSDLAEAAGVSYQQMQKYEKATNRISPSRLVRFAEALGVTPGWFFEGRDGLIGTDSGEAPSLMNVTASDLAVARDVARLSPQVRQRAVSLIRALAEEAPTPADD